MHPSPLRQPAASEWLSSATDVVTQFVREKPGLSLLLAATAGGVAAWLIKKVR
jgi:hypothetical protein